MDAEKWHRRIEEKLEAPRQTRPITKKIIPPCTQENQAARQSVEKPALCHNHGEEHVFPREFGLEILKLPGSQDGKPSQPPVEKKGGHRKSAAPAPECPRCESRSCKRRPDQAAFHRNPDEQKQAVPQICTEWIAQRHAR